VNPKSFKHYVDCFNSVDDEAVRNAVGNKDCWEWMEENVPWFECPDRDIEQIYYFRWWVFRKHLVRTPAGFAITEFLPKVDHAGPRNTIPCAAGLHIEEGRWLRNRHYVADYIRFWCSPESGLRKYSSWFADAVYGWCRTTGHFEIGEPLLDTLVANYEAWEDSNRHASGLFWSRDSFDGGEYSISGSGLRPTLNSYMYGDAVAVARLAARCGCAAIADRFEEKAARLRELVQTRLWDPEKRFFCVFPLDAVSDPVDDWNFSAIPADRRARELWGYLPWKFRLPEVGYEEAWSQFVDEHGFSAPYGPTTAEQRHPRFMKYRVKRCQWDGSTWPFMTSLAIGAMANLLREYEQGFVDRRNLLEAMQAYARSQHRALPYGGEVPWIGESLHPRSGIWLSRAIALEMSIPLVKTRPVMKDMNHALTRGQHYNHSSYCDLVISGLIGLRFEDDGAIVVDPLVPEDTWEWFALDGVEYGGVKLTVLYDRTGKKYGRGAGLTLLADGRRIGHATKLRALTGTTMGPTITP
jgi:hypothetical protein